MTTGIALAKPHGTYLVFDILQRRLLSRKAQNAGMLPESSKRKETAACSVKNFRHAFNPAQRWLSARTPAFTLTDDNAKQFGNMNRMGQNPLDHIQACNGHAGLISWAGPYKIGALRNRPLCRPHRREW